MNLFIEFFNLYGMEILFTLVTAVAGFIGMQIKAIFDKYITDKRAKAVVETCVSAIEQLYHDLDGAEKYQKAVANAQEMLESKGIAVTSLELEMLIEAAVSAFNYGFNGKKVRNGSDTNTLCE